MIKPGKLYALYQFYLSLVDDPRTDFSDFHKTKSPYRSKDGTYNFLNKAFAENVIVGPFLWCNYGFSVSLVKKSINPLKVIRKLKEEESPSITHAIALSGDYSLLQITRGGNQLSYAEAIKPSFPAQMSLENLSFSKKGVLPKDPSPGSWNEMDWKVFHAMRNPRISFVEAGRRVGTSWITVKRHYDKIVNECKSFTAFFPKGYDNYESLLVTFKTKYEIGMKESLEKVDRSSYLWKFDDMIILILFVDDYNRTVNRFTELEENGMIHKLRASIPIRYYEPYINLGRASQDLSLHQVGRFLHL